MRLAWIVLVAILVIAPVFAPYAEDAQDRWHANEAPTPAHWMGTDEFGRDVFSRFLHGGHLSALGGLAATTLALLMATAVGGTAGLGSKWVDQALMRASELFLSLPWAYLLLAGRAILPLRLSETTAFWLLVLVMAATGWAKPARLIRGVVLSAREKTYITVARAMGAKETYIFQRHILPRLKSVLWVQVAILFPQFVAADITLSFLGLGTGEPKASWGSLLAGLRHFSTLESHRGRWAPLVLMVLVLAALQWFGISAKRRRPVVTAETIQ